MITALGVWLVSLVVYSLTKAPTLSFWDCGEFIAASYVLGIPHPPGSPLYVLFGRLFSVLPLWSDVSVRVNMLSAFCSSFTALFGYLIIARILRAWFRGDPGLYSRILIFAGAAAGALYAAFSVTNWNNSVEAEVYGMALMFMTALVWLTLVYFEQQGTPFGDKIMLLIVYIAFLGVGIHMSVFLVLPFALLYFIIKKSAATAIWHAGTIFFFLELYLIFAFSSRPGEVPYYVPVIIVTVVYFFYVFSFERIPKYHLLIGAGFLLACLPLFGTAVSSLSGADPTSAESPALLSLIGKTILVVLNILAVIILYAFFQARRKRQPPPQLLTSAIFILATSFLIGALNSFKGYYPFLVATAVLSLVLLLVIRKHINWSILLALGGALLIVLGVKEFFYGLLAAFVLVAVLGLARKLPQWRQALMILLCALIGYSTHLFIPIRSAQDPALNENDPSESLTATINFLERKQYGSQSMIDRMFERRGEWINQFGPHRRMGFWGFFQEQYGLSGPSFVFVFLLGLFGVWETIRRKPRLGLPLAVLLLLCTVGLVLYMNFADGTRQHPVTGQDYLEVRNRDYFFTPGFVLFGFVIGMGTAGLLQMLRESISQFSSGPRRVILTSALVLFLFPTYTFATNYHICDRSYNFIPYDYGWNLLDSTPENGILFTHGDNDTFPLWCLQEVYNIRPDVNVVNLSLANTKWYIKQLVDYQHLDLGWTHADIDALQPFRTRDGLTFRLQDQVVDAIVDNYYGRRPVCFSVTVGQGARQYKGRPLDRMLRMVGMVWEVAPTQEAYEVDVDRSLAFFLGPDRFAARGVNDPDVYQNEATRRLTRNYGNAFLMVADTLRKADRIDEALELALTAVEKIPHAGDPIEFAARIYADRGEVDELRQLMDLTYAGDREKLRILLARAQRNSDNIKGAEETLISMLTNDPNNREAFDALMRMYVAEKRVSSMKRLLEEWLRFNPEDQAGREALKDIGELLRSDSLDRGVQP